VVGLRFGYEDREFLLAPRGEGRQHQPRHRVGALSIRWLPAPLGLGGYCKTVTVLFAEESWPNEEEQEDEELGAWKPSFHRWRRR